MAEKEIILTFKQRTKGMLLCYIIFIVLYMSAQFYAVNMNKSDAYILPLDNYIAFLEWMIIPYATSAIFFVLIFYWVKDRCEYLLLIKRMIAVTVLAFIGFILFPIQFSFERPAISHKVIQPLYDFITTWDSAYNQSPSLHVAYAIIFWTVVRKRFNGPVKYALGLWLILVIISTLFVFQHHAIDIFTAIFLCLFVLYIIPNPSDLLYKNVKIGLVYFALATSLALLSAICFTKWSIILLWICVNLMYIGASYINSNSYFIKDAKGNISCWKKIVFTPYLFTYKVLRYLNGKYKPIAIVEFLPDFYIGSRLSTKTAKQYFKDKSIIAIDLSTEIKENSYLKNNNKYVFIPLIDIAANENYKIQQAVDQIVSIYQTKNKNEVIYMHCAMGYSRSMTLAMHIYCRLKNCDRKEAIQYVRALNKHAIIKSY